MTVQELLNSNYGVAIIYLIIVIYVYLICILNAKWNEMPKEVFQSLIFAAWLPFANIVIALFLTIVFIAGMIFRFTSYIMDRVYK